MENNYIQCQCGDHLSPHSLANHIKSKRHNENLQLRENKKHQVLDILKKLIDKDIDFILKFTENYININIDVSDDRIQFVSIDDSENGIDNIV